MPGWMNIGEAAAAAGVSPKMIRHYEQIGLVPAATRTEAGYRQYSERDVSILRFIRQSRRLGFSMEQIAGLLSLWSNRRRTSREVKALAQGHLDALEEKMRELAQMQAALTRLVATCHGDDDPDCAILDELAGGSAQAPEPGSIGGTALRKTARKSVGEGAGKGAGKGASERPVRRAATASHVDLMAWTRNIHAAHGH